METELVARAEQFAAELASTVSSFTGEDCEFVAQRVGNRVSIRESSDKGVPLKVEKVPHLTLVVDFQCEWASSGRYLAIETSSVGVFPGGKAEGEPLFRFDYVRQPSGPVASAHLQVHAHRDAFTHALSSAGRKKCKRQAVAEARPRGSARPQQVPLSPRRTAFPSVLGGRAGGSQE